MMQYVTPPPPSLIQTIDLITQMHSGHFDYLFFFKVLITSSLKKRKPVRSNCFPPENMIKTKLTTFKCKKDLKAPLTKMKQSKQH